MTTTTTGTSLYEACEALFEQYPLAASPLNGDGTQFMTLAVTTGATPSFFILTRVRGAGSQPFCRLDTLDENGVKVLADETIEETGALSPAAAGQILRGAFPLPRHGSLFGWAPDGEVTTLVAFYDHGGPGDGPVNSPMPRMGIPESGWPSFVGETLLGPWIWEHYGAGRLVGVGRQLAGTAGQVLWADTTAVIGCGVTVVTQDVPLSGGVVLPAGQYVYFQALRDGARLRLGDVLGGRYKLTDLSDAFNPPA